MENFALITLAGELRASAVGMTVRRVVRYPGRAFFLETRSGKMPGLRLWLDAPSPWVWIPNSRMPAPETETDDFVMVLRKHLLSARLREIAKPLSERIIEFAFTTALPSEELREVLLVAELLPNSPNLLLLDRSRRILATALPLPPRRGLSQFDAYLYPPTGKIPLETLAGEDRAWLDPEAFLRDPSGWLLGRVAGVGPVLAGEIAVRSRAWPRTGEAIGDGIRTLVGQLQRPARTSWVYTHRPIGLLGETGDPEGLRQAIISPIELLSMAGVRSVQTYPGMLAAMAAVLDLLETSSGVDRARAPELRRLGRELRKIRQQKHRLLERQARFDRAGAQRDTARLLASSGADMDRHHASVEVTEYTETGASTHSVPLDPARTLRENTDRMFREQRKATRGLGMIATELARLEEEERRVRERERRLKSITHWDAWLAATGPGRPRREPRKASAAPPRRRHRTVDLDGHQVLIGRNSRENDELTFRVAADHDFWFHVADYSGSHVIVRNPSGRGELEQPLLIRAAQLAAYYSQARNSSKVAVHYTQRKYVTKPRKARPGLVQLRQFHTVTVEPRDQTREELAPVDGQGSRVSGEGKA